MKQAIVAVVVAVAALIVVCELWPSRPTITREMKERPRVCDACGYRFDGPGDPVVVECPKCHKRAGVRVQFYQCRSCGHRFEAFRVRTADTTLRAIDPDKPPPELVYKRQGGEWVKSIKELGKLQCPKCNSAEVGPPLPQ